MIILLQFINRMYSLFRRQGVMTIGVLALLLVAVVGAGCDGPSSEEQPAVTPLKIGLLLNFTGSTEASADRQRAFDLALRHINEGGGVFGMPVTGVVVDSTGNPDTAVQQARHLVEVEGAHAIVGPNASSAALPISETISATLRVPTVSSSATSPQLTDVDDNGYFFRTALSDVAQGPVLADITRRQSFDNVGLIYQDDAYGAGLADAFADSWDGELTSVPVDPGEVELASVLNESANGGGKAWSLSHSKVWPLISLDRPLMAARTRTLSLPMPPSG